MTDTTTCHDWITLHPGDTPWDGGCPPTINRATFIATHPSPEPFSVVDFLIPTAVVLAVVVALILAMVVAVKRAGRPKHSRDV